MHLYTCEILGCMAAIAALELIVKNADFDKKKNFNADAKYVLEKVGVSSYRVEAGQMTRRLAFRASQRADGGANGGFTTMALLIPAPLERTSFIPPRVVAIGHQACLLASIHEKGFA